MISLFKRVLFLFAIMLVLLMPMTSVYAHELLPSQVREYLEANPNATPEEIKLYADTQTPDFASQFRDGAEILRIAKNQDTSFFDNFFDFWKLGIGHILGGADHVLFVLSLLLVFVSWREILKLTATFTVAHSITLILGGQGIVTLSPRVVEPFIAFSIAYVAFTSVFMAGKKFVGESRGKLAMVFFFGLFHGLGFAGLLAEIQVPADTFISSLFAFNIGIEFGQIFIVLCALPLIYFCKEKSWYGHAVKGAAILVIALGLFWGLQRIFE